VAEMSFGLKRTSEQWAGHYEATMARPAWETVRRAIELSRRMRIQRGNGSPSSMSKIVKPGWVVEEGPPDPPYFPALRVIAFVLVGLVFVSLLGLGFPVFLLLVVGW
jgi:hypothetical protein